MRRRPRGRMARCCKCRPTRIRRAQGLRGDRRGSRCQHRPDPRARSKPAGSPEDARGFRQRQRRRVALAQRAVLPSEGHGVGGRHPRAGDLPLDLGAAGRPDAVAGRHHDGSHARRSSRSPAARSPRRATRESICCRSFAGTTRTRRADALLARWPRARSGARHAERGLEARHGRPEAAPLRRESTTSESDRTWPPSIRIACGR